ncbi:hypothetical protein HPB49_002228 [Dermacentor silvarum]|uniref:Uncharacterized protein n=1 Tax=Dermacentor silvarum TaxID=543639 RepID=A0ACB8DA38_DERSI|nr:hypothetical protein HPB49_002228 [Dermacentor silvarum]
MVLCAVFGCSNRSKTKKRRQSANTNLFRLPKVVHNQCDRTRTLSAKRRSLWLARIRRADLDTNRADIRVCGAHFVSGRPSKLWEETNPDWAPSLLLGYGSRVAAQTELTSVGLQALETQCLALNEALYTARSENEQLELSKAAFQGCAVGGEHTTISHAQDPHLQGTIS